MAFEDWDQAVIKFRQDDLLAFAEDHNEFGIATLCIDGRKVEMVIDRNNASELEPVALTGWDWLNADPFRRELANFYKQFCEHFHFSNDESTDLLNAIHRIERAGVVDPRREVAQEMADAVMAMRADLSALVEKLDSIPAKMRMH